MHLRLIAFFAALLLLCTAMLLAADTDWKTILKKGKTTKNKSQVTLVESEVHDKDNNNIGLDYYIYNTSSKKISVKIKLKKGDNIENSLHEGAKRYLNANEYVYMGRVVQKDLSKKATWSVEWTTTLVNSAANDSSKTKETQDDKTSLKNNPWLYLPVRQLSSIFSCATAHNLFLITKAQTKQS